MVRWSTEAFLALENFREIVLVLSGGDISRHGDWWRGKGVKVTESGPTRLDSVRNGVKAVSKDVSVIAVHDGARPLVSSDIITACVTAAQEHGASVPSVAVKDTLKIASVDGKTVDRTVDRARYLAAQTPQCYRRRILEEALEKFKGEKDATDESQLVERLGRRVFVVPSSYDNIKVTTPEDLVIAEALMKQRKKAGPGGPAGNVRVGFGYDIHRMVEGRPLILGGMRIPHNKGLLGHSDGDVLLHAVCDAALGAVAAGEIGMMFPPTDLTIRGISSTAIVDRVLEMLEKRKVRILQLDVSVVAEEPKIRPYYQALRESVSKIFKLPLEDVSVKAKSREGLGEIGHGEAIACYAVVTVSVK